jgi:hypothetical protein
MEKCPKCGSSEIGGVEYWYMSPERYDGVSEWNCLNCGYRQGRWTGKELKDGQIESRYGERGVVDVPKETGAKDAA